MNKRVASVCRVIAALCLSSGGAGSFVCAETEISLMVAPQSERVTRIAYQLQIRGKMLVPAPTGGDNTSLKLSSSADFVFDQRQFPSAVTGPPALRAIRRFAQAGSRTVVGEDHMTTVQLPEAGRTIQVLGSDSTLIQFSPEVRLTRQHVDLLQFSCDPLAVAGLLPGRAIQNESEKWNTDAWVIPLLAGMDATVSQSAACHLVSLNPSEAVVGFDAQAEGAISGAPSKVQLRGQLTFDRTAAIITKLAGVRTETRGAGAVSPGLDITADIQWTQEIVTPASNLPTELSAAPPAAAQLMLTLVTPWRLRLVHPREWHLFHETNDLIILRMLHNGSLTGQCNLSRAATVPAGEFTAEEEFLESVRSQMATAGGSIATSEVLPNRSGWRVHHVRASSEAGQKTIVWDYYLCSADTGEQFSVIFSHAGSDDAIFGDAADEILRTMTIRPRRTGTPLPK